MLRFLFSKLLLIIPTFIGITIVAFGFVRVLPGEACGRLAACWLRGVFRVGDGRRAVLAEGDCMLSGVLRVAGIAAGDCTLSGVLRVGGLPPLEPPRPGDVDCRRVGVREGGFCACSHRRS